MSFFSSAGAILTGGAAIIGALKGEGKQGKQAAQTGQAQSQFALDMGRAIADPTSTSFQNILAAEEELARKRYQSALESIFVQHARDRARGGRGVITTPQRQDETLFRLLARNRQVDDPAARARAALSLAGQTAVGGNAAGAAQALSNVGQTQRDVLAAGAEGAGAVLGGLESLFANRPTQNPPTTSSGVGQSLPTVRLR